MEQKIFVLSFLVLSFFLGTAFGQDTAAGAPECSQYCCAKDNKFPYQRSHFVTVTNDNVFVTDRYADTLYVYQNNAGEDTFGSINIHSTSFGGFDQPSGYELDKITGDFFIADIKNSRIVHFNNDGTVKNTFGDASGAGQLSGGPHDIAIHPDSRELYITDTENERVAIYSQDGTYKGELSPGEPDPTTLAFDSLKQLYVTHKKLGMVYVHNVDSSVPVRKVLIGSTVKPKQLNVDSSDRIFIATSETDAAGQPYGAVRVYDNLDQDSGNSYCIIKNFVPSNGDPSSNEIYGVDVDSTSGAVWATDGPRDHVTGQGGHVYSLLCNGPLCQPQVKLSSYRIIGPYGSLRVNSQRGMYRGRFHLPYSVPKK